MRGQRSRSLRSIRALRIIPARAGPTYAIEYACELSADHPRSCGANHRDTGCAEYGDGSSPLVRGQHPIQPRRIANQRIIPARAGPTDAGVPYVATGSDHPRSCGANLTAVTGTSIISGSSPLVRGQHQHDLLPTPFLRIIPARAGPTWRRTQGPRAAADHPRSCGANHLNITPRVEQFGSSPLVRGQQFIDVSDSFECRIIPARAGPTMFVSSRAFSNADHPRSCGANTTRRPYGQYAGGSSPLVRGQQFIDVSDSFECRIIPARAGPTMFVSSRAFSNADHPRSCGANTTRRPYGQYAGGSSPLVRGQLGACDIHVSRERIIPARAGPTRINPCH